MHPTATLIISAAALVAIYVIWNLVRPFMDCSACNGGKKRTGRTWNFCKVCEGSNKKVRPGRYLLRLFGIPLPK